MPKKTVSLFAFCSATLLCGLSAFGQGLDDGGGPPSRPADGVSVTAPKNAAVRPEEAINLQGHIRVQGSVEEATKVSGRVEVGYNFASSVWNDISKKWENQNRFIILHPVEVSVVVQPGDYAGRGKEISFEKWVIANPPWKEGIIYQCIGSPRDSEDSIGSFSVGRLPSSFLPPWLRWILG